MDHPGTEHQPRTTSEQKAWQRNTVCTIRTRTGVRRRKPWPHRTTIHAGTDSALELRASWPLDSSASCTNPTLSVPPLWHPTSVNNQGTTQMSSPWWMHLPNGDEGVLQRACSRHGVHIGAEARRAHDHPATVPEVAPEHGADDWERLTHLALCSQNPVMSTTPPRPLASVKLSRATNLVHVQQF